MQGRQAMGDATSAQIASKEQKLQPHPTIPLRAAHQGLGSDAPTSPGARTESLVNAAGQETCTNAGTTTPD